jgi:hypothetical protein
MSTGKLLRHLCRAHSGPACCLLLNWFEPQPVELIGNTQYARAISWGWRGSHRAKDNNKMGGGERQVDVSGVIRLGRNQLGTEARFVEVHGQGGVTHGSGFVDKDGDVEDVVFPGIHAGSISSVSG